MTGELDRVGRMGRWRHDRVPRTGRWRRPVVLAGLVVAVAALVVATRTTAVWDLVTDGDRFAEWVADRGVAAPVAFVLLFTALVPLGVPGLAFVLPAAVVWPAPVAVALVMVGGMTSSMVGVWAARTGGRRRLAARLPRRLAAWDERLARRGFLGVVALRLVTYLAAPADWLLGLSAVPMRTVVTGTFAGLLPPTVVYVAGGSAGLRRLSSLPPAAWAAVAAVGAVAIAAFGVRRTRAARLAVAPPAAARTPPPGSPNVRR